MRRIIKRWKDGASQQRDPTGDDPLFYYLAEDDWSNAMAFEIRPFWEERAKDSVEIDLVGDRPDDLRVADNEDVVSRVAPAIVERHPHWRAVTIGPSPLGQALCSQA